MSMFMQCTTDSPCHANNKSCKDVFEYQHSNLTGRQEFRVIFMEMVGWAVAISLRGDHTANTAAPLHPID